MKYEISQQSHNELQVEIKEFVRYLKDFMMIVKADNMEISIDIDFKRNDKLAQIHYNILQTKKTILDYPIIDVDAE